MVHVTTLGFTMDELQQAIDAGDVRSQVHPEFPELRIYGYTEETQFKNKWNKITLATRGLILNQNTGEVIARPWEKFFNFGQMDNRIESNAPVEVTDKLDGSLGILYRQPDGKFAIATRGSFASEQAIHATNLLNTLYEDYLVDWVGAYWLEQNTYLFEIIYPDNRIVVDYQGQDDLVLLGAVNMEYGQYYGPTSAGAQIAWPGPMAESWEFERFVDALSFPDRKGKEGVVIRSGRNIVKLKQADYVELHRIVTNLSPKTIWEMLSRGQTVDEICAPLPDEFYKYVEDIAEELSGRVMNILFTVNLEFSRIERELWKEDGSEITRAQWARQIKNTTYPSLTFLRLDNRSMHEAVWKMVKPRGDVKTLVKDDGE